MLIIIANYYQQSLLILSNELLLSGNIQKQM